MYFLENEEEFLNLLENEQNFLKSQNFSQGALFDDIGETKLIEDLVGYLPTEEKELKSDYENPEIRVSQKPIPPGISKKN